MRTAWIALVTFLLAMPVGRAADNMKAFPPADAGMVRHVLQLPPQDDETGFKVELIVGRMVQVDEANRYFFGGRIEEETIQGWGLTLYKLRQLGPLAGTRMAVDPQAPKVERFVALGGDQYLLRYNSRLPLVVYVPAGVEVRYRIWTAEARSHPIEEG